MVKTEPSLFCLHSFSKQNLLLDKKIKMREEVFGVLVFNKSNFHIFQINHTGRQILELCDGKHSLIDIISMTNVDNVELKESITFFLKTMVSMNIIKVVNKNE